MCDVVVGCRPLLLLLLLWIKNNSSKCCSVRDVTEISSAAAMVDESCMSLLLGSKSGQEFFFMVKSEDSVWRARLRCAQLVLTSRQNVGVNPTPFQS